MYKEKVFLIGGTNTSGTISQTIEEINIRTLQHERVKWNMICLPPDSIVSFMAEVKAFDETEIVIMGGTNFKGEYKDDIIVINSLTG